MDHRITQYAPLVAGLGAAALAYSRKQPILHALAWGAGAWFVSDFAIGFVKGFREAAQQTAGAITQTAASGAASSVLAQIEQGGGPQMSRAQMEAVAEGRPATPGAPPPSATDIIAAKQALRGVRVPLRPSR